MHGDRDSVSVEPCRARRVRHSVEAGGLYRIENYDEALPFSSFLPGIAGPAGAPLWAMYVNRGQGIVSFGTQGKDGAILEFLPATWAYQLAGLQGFRTLCKIDGEYYEPFQRGEANLRCQLSRAMQIEMDRVAVEERNGTLEMAWHAEHFALVNRPLPALIRRVTFTNLAPARRRLQVLDGLPLIQPAGFTDRQMKRMRRLSEAYASVRLIGGVTAFYSARVRAHDEAEVLEITEGNFCAVWQLGAEGRLVPLEPVVDPDVVFGQGQDLVTPRLFLANGEIDRSAQTWENRLGCALAPVDCSLAAGESLTLLSLTGAAPSETLACELIEEFESLDAFDRASDASRALVREISDPAFTVSAHPALDAYARQNFLDNVLRGGVPVLVPSRQGPALVHLYSRKHGDLERDYNDFVVPATPLSDGVGNFRDVLQNRRSDVWFHPETLDAEIRLFVSLLQPDGYNPLQVFGHRFRLGVDCEASAVCPAEDPEARRAFEKLVRRPFAPGEVLAWADLHGVQGGPVSDWFTALLQQCDRLVVAHGHEGGHWIDHWTYLVDLLDAFSSVHPERVPGMLTEGEPIEWFDDGAFVQPRSRKHVLRPQGPLQIHALTPAPPTAHRLPGTTVLGKLCALVAIKAVSFDFEGKGIEMDAGRPGWNDAMNGLPGLFGSSTCETAALVRICEWLREHLPQARDTTLPAVVADLIDEAVADLRPAAHDWNRAATIRERFRQRVRDGKDLAWRTVPGAVLDELLTLAERRARRGIELATDPATGLLHTYYVAEPREYDIQREADGAPRLDPATGSPLISVRGFAQRPLPLFLEGQVNLLRLASREEGRRIHRAVRASALFDETLRMYKLNENLAECSQRIGRARTFTRGWFENESIWLHMSHKYLIELLRKGLTEEFHADAATMLVPFMDPLVYGRSVLENSSFLGSSANPDPKTHGRGFVARLSGTTAEFIQIWLLLTLGPKPFVWDGARMRLDLHPQLPASWFTQRETRGTWHGEAVVIPPDAFACAFMGQCLLVYHNSVRRNTYGPGGVSPSRAALDGGAPQPWSDIADSAAGPVRSRCVQRLDVWLEPVG